MALALAAVALVSALQTRSVALTVAPTADGPQGWIFDDRSFPEEPGPSACPDNHRNADCSECLEAVQQAAAMGGLQVKGLKKVNSGETKRVPRGCSYSVETEMAVCNYHPKGAPTRGRTYHYQLACIDLSHEALAAANEEQADSTADKATQSKSARKPTPRRNVTSRNSWLDRYMASIMGDTKEEGAFDRAARNEKRPGWLQGWLRATGNQKELEPASPLPPSPLSASSSTNSIDVRRTLYYWSFGRASNCEYVTQKARYYAALINATALSLSPCHSTFNYFKGEAYFLDRFYNVDDLGQCNTSFGQFSVSPMNMTEYIDVVCVCGEELQTSSDCDKACTYENQVRAPADSPWKTSPLRVTHVYSTLDALPSTARNVYFANMFSAPAGGFVKFSAGPQPCDVPRLSAEVRTWADQIQSRTLELRRPTLCVHWRREDFKLAGRGSSFVMDCAVTAMLINERVRKDSLEAVLLLTNPEEKGVSNLTGRIEGARAFDASELTASLSRDEQIYAEKELCTRAAAFIGTRGSSFSQSVSLQRLRVGRSNGDSFFRRTANLQLEAV